MVKGRKVYFRWLGVLSTVGITIVATTAMGFLIGYWLDSLLGTKPWLMILFLILGIFAGFRNLFSIISRVTKNKDMDNDL
ncbi:MAG: AtpZ/AtpI family protein [Nitrospirota bacterium]|jgi:ATP synthase protein I